MNAFFFVNDTHCIQRELARQTFEGLSTMAAALVKGGYPELRPLLCIGGIDMREQYDVLKR